MSSSLALGAIVNGTTLAKAVAYSLIAGVGLATAFGIAVTSAAGMLEAARSKRGTATAAWAALMVVAGFLVLGGVAAGIVAMASG